MEKPTFNLMNDLTAAQWLIDNETQWRGEAPNPIAAFVPPIFESYISVRHDNALGKDEAGLEIDWELFTKLLMSFTNNPNDCYFALWDGYGIDYEENHPELFVERHSLLQMDLQRDYYLFHGKLLDSLNINFNDPYGFPFMRPNLAWPSDRSWMYLNEIDFEVALIGGSEALIRAIEKSPLYKTERFAPETLIKDIFLVAPWNSGEQSWLPPYVTKRMWLRHRLADKLDRLSWKIRGWL